MPAGRARRTASIVGHVHLRVGDPTVAEEWWHKELGFDTMAKYGAEAVFLSTGGYHHHIGANTWQSRGAGAPRQGSHRAELGRARFERTPTRAGIAKEDPWGNVIRTVPE
jgi:catechol 2,3-dioxygenase